MKIGLIAGGGQFPILFSQKARKNGYHIVAAAFKAEAEPLLSDYVDELKWLYLGQLSKLIRYFRQNEVSKAVMLGTIQKTNIFTNIRPDLKALAFIAKNKKNHDDSILTAFADFLGKEGIEILPSTFLLPELISPDGCWTKRKPNKAENEDIVEGWRIAKEIGKLDIGQCLVSSNGTILAIEAVEGTDATILRGGQLSGNKGCVVIKLAKPYQDLRFDVPSSGLQTIKTMKQAGATCLVLESGKTLAFDREEMIAFADKHDIAIVARS
jgi:UDP-2,3-diacylglucosamine hydrolase